jgi:hypothetical protein
MLVVTLHRKKKDREFPIPRRDVTTKLSLGGNNDVITELFLPRGSLVSDIPAGDEKLVNLFLRCILSLVSLTLMVKPKERSAKLVRAGCRVRSSIMYTDKNVNKIFLIHNEIQSGEVTKSYMWKGFLIYEEMRKYFPLYEEAVRHI